LAVCVTGHRRATRCSGTIGRLSRTAPDLRARIDSGNRRARSGSMQARDCSAIFHSNDLAIIKRSCRAFGVTDRPVA
jgi:hypothetical protein